MANKPWWKPPYTLDIVWAVLPFALVAIGWGVQPLKSWDYWWHIAFGRMISVTHEMPVHAHWLYTMAADTTAWVQPWLSQWFLFSVHDTFGLHAVLLLRNLMAAAAFGILGLWASRRANSMMIGAVLALFVSAFGFFTIAARSHLMAWPLFLILMPLAYGLRAGKLPKPALLAFPAITALWCNLHGTFPVPPVVAVAFAAAEFVDWLRDRDGYNPSGPSWKLWAGTVVAALLATGANPRGYHVWEYLLLLSLNQELRQTVTEWWPTTPFSPVAFGALFYVMLIGGLALMWKHRERLDYADLFMVLWIAILTIPQARFMLWFCLAFPVAVAPYLRKESVEEEPPSTVMQGANVLIAVGLVLTGLAVQPWGKEHPIAAQVQAAPTRTKSPDLGLAQADAPYAATAMVKERFGDKPPRIFHDHRYPGFILYELNAQPFQQLVYLDNRVELPENSEWRRFDAIGRGENADAELQKMGVEAVITSYEQQEGLIEFLKGSTNWDCPVDEDEYVLCWRHYPVDPEDELHRSNEDPE